jgi:cytidyltransferase-like protein
MNAKHVIVSGGFDDLRSRHLRFLEEAAKLGELTVVLWPDETLQALMGKPPKFPLPERGYFLNAVRWVSRVIELRAPVDPDAFPTMSGVRPDIWVDGECRANGARRAFCQQQGIEYRVLPAAQMDGFPDPTALPRSADLQSAVSQVCNLQTAAAPSAPSRLQIGDTAECNSALPKQRKKVVVTGCYDWFHSGHVRFFEEVSAYGDLYVIVGHDANIRLLKGEGHPLVSQKERRYVCGSIKYVKQALISTGEGWLDADPEIQRLKPDIYAVNEDGDKGGKREYCDKLGIEYLVLKRTPAPGLPKRSSTDLRGF